VTVDLRIDDGTCVTPTGCVTADVAVNDGSIVAVGTDLPPAEETVDADGQLVMPGFVDPHVHIDDSASVDSYRTASAAAALGGITTVIDFAWQTDENDPDNDPRPLMEGVRRKREKADASGTYVDYALHGSLTVEDPAVLTELSAAVEAGIVSFKMFTAYDFGISNGFIRRALEHIADLDAVGVFHTEDDSVCTDLVAQFKSEGKSDPTWYPRSRPDYAEAMAADDVLRLAEAAGAKYYGIHTTSRDAAEVIDDYRDDGSHVRAETCTHYCALDDSVFEEMGNLPLIAPPIRKPDDIDAMFEHLRQGTLSVVSTDHAPQLQEDKQVDWWDSPYGAGSLQVSVPVFHEAAVNQRNVSYPALVAAMSTNPAETFGLMGKGTLDPGTDADLVIFDPDKQFTITADDTVSKQDFSLYEGWDVTGAVVDTFVRGEPVVRDGTLVGDPDHGRFVERSVPDWSV
jgi:dihydropyrimidinase